MWFGNATLQQAAALPFIPLHGRFEVLLITSRERRRWLLPKGWPGKDGSLAEAARREAEEEAGVVGSVHPAAIGTFTYSKKMVKGYRVPCRVTVYPLLVRRHCIDWREKAERSLRWCCLEEAPSLVDDRGLAAVLAGLAARGGAALHDAMASIDRATGDATLRPPG